MKVVFCTPTRAKPHDAYLKAMEDSIPVLDAAGIKHSIAFEVGCPYISSAMATLVRKAMDAMPDAIVMLDDDLSWRPHDLLALIESKADVIGGTYRFKKPEIEYMGGLHTTPDGLPIGEYGKQLKADKLPSGFLKISAHAIDLFMQKFPELHCGPAYHPTIDLFNHGAHNRLWYGQDYAFCRNYQERCGEVFLMPDLNINHHSWIDDSVYEGNFHQFLRHEPGGDLSASPKPPSNVVKLPTQIDALRAAMGG
jgi:hypothetical protein